MVDNERQVRNIGYTEGLKSIHEQSGHKHLLRTLVGQIAELAFNRGEEHIIPTIKAYKAIRSEEKGNSKIK